MGKGMTTCVVCGRDFDLIAEEHYVARSNEYTGLKAIAGSEVIHYDAFDCPHCGCQNVMQERRFASCPCDYGICDECDHIGESDDHDGCVGCAYSDKGSEEEPCVHCRSNYPSQYDRYDRYEKEEKPENTNVADMRSYLADFCVGRACFGCPLHKDEFSCGRGKYFTMDPGDRGFMTDEDIERYYKAVKEAGYE